MLILVTQGCLESPSCLLHDVCSTWHRFWGAPLLVSQHRDLSPGDPAVNLPKQHLGMEKPLAGNRGRAGRCPARRSRAGGMGRHGAAQHLPFCTWPLLAPPVPLLGVGICPGTSRPCPKPMGRSWAGIWDVGASSPTELPAPKMHRAPRSSVPLPLRILPCRKIGSDL